MTHQGSRRARPDRSVGGKPSKDSFPIRVHPHRAIGIGAADKAGLGWRLPLELDLIAPPRSGDMATRLSNILIGGLPGLRRAGQYSRDRTMERCTSCALGEAPWRCRAFTGPPAARYEMMVDGPNWRVRAAQTELR